MKFFLACALLFILGLNNKSYCQTIYTAVKTGFAAEHKDWYNVNNLSHGAADLAIDHSGNIYYTNDTIVIKVEILTGKKIIIAGGLRGYSGDSGLATDARLSGATAMVIDSKDNIIFCDAGNHRIRKISSDGRITTIAGNGSAGYSGDGFLATSASFGSTIGLGIDKLDNIYLADTRNYRVRKINNKTGVISTVAGVGYHGWWGEGRLATNAPLNAPRDVAVNSAGDLFICDQHKIWKVGIEDKLLTTYFDSYLTIAVMVDDSDHVYITNQEHAILKIKSAKSGERIAGGVYGFFGDGGPAINAMFRYLDGLAFDKKNQTLYVYDRYNCRIRAIADIPESPTTPNDYISYCQNEIPYPYSATGTNLRWYNSALGGSAYSAPPVPNTDKPDTITYFVSQTVAGIESSRKAIVTIINKRDTVKLWSPEVNICQWSTHQYLHLYINSTTEFPYFKWYSDSLKTSVLDSFPVINTSEKARTQHFVTTINHHGCEGPLTSFWVNVYQPALPHYDSVINLCKGQPARLILHDTSSLTWFKDKRWENPSYITPVINTVKTGKTNYFFVKVDSLWCASDLQQIEVNVHPVPDPPNIITPLTFCQKDKNDSIPVFSPGVLWFDHQYNLLGDRSFKPSTLESGTFTYYIRERSLFGCESDFVPLIMQVNPKPEIFSSVDSVIFRTGYTLTLIASSDIAQKFLWNTGNEQTHFDYIPTKKGLYKFWVKGISEHGCSSDTSFQELYIDADKYWQSKIHFFPNPCTNMINVTGLNLSDIHCINLRTTDGLIVSQSKIPADSYTLIIPDYLPSGYYIVEVDTIGRANPSRVIYKK